MIQKPNVTLTTKNTGRWMVLSTRASNEKQRYRIKYYSYSLNWHAAAIIQSYGKWKELEPNEECKDLRRYAFKLCYRF